MTAEEYQVRAHAFANYGSKMYPYLGLAEEAGEVCGKVAKFMRHNLGLDPHCELNYALHEQKEEYRKEIIKELGDVLWMLSEVATLNDVSLEELMERNIAKLTDRKARGVIDGSGDNR